MRLWNLVACLFVTCLFAQAQSQTPMERVHDDTHEILFTSESSRSSTEPLSISTNPIKDWAMRYKGTGDSTDVAKDIAVDGSGNVYVTGYSIAANGYYDYVTIKYNNTGGLQWVARYNGLANSNDEAQALVVDDSGNVYVTGSSIASNGYYDYVTIKYNSMGTRQWVARYHGPGNDDKAYAVVIDGSGNVYVTGYSNSANANTDDYLTIKYNNAGVRQWVARYDGRVGGTDRAYALAVDSFGNVYVTGYTITDEGQDYATLKYDSAGVRQWLAIYIGQKSGGSDIANAITVDNSGNVYVTGKGANDYATVKYNNAGVRQWVVRYNGPGGVDDARDLAVDNAGNIYVTGYSSNYYVYQNYHKDFATVKYNSAGVVQWVARYDRLEKYDGLWKKDDEAYALVLDESGNVYVTGYSIDAGGYKDYATIKYNNAGFQQWVTFYNGPVKSHDGANAIAVDGVGNVYITGYSTSSNGTMDYVTIKYSETVANSEIISKSNDKFQVKKRGTPPATFELSQNFPNPFNPTTTIRFAIPTAEHVKLVIYNLSGKLARTVIDNETSAGYHHVTFDANGLASGIYFYRLEVGSFIATRKMMLLE